MPTGGYTHIGAYPCDGVGQVLFEKNDHISKKSFGIGLRGAGICSKIVIRICQGWPF